MVRNKLEKLFSKSLKADDELWGMKLHNNMLAHQTTPADYIISYQDLAGLTLHLVECKLVTCKELAQKNSKGRFAFKRFKQAHDLTQFANKFPLYHEGWLCLGFFDKRWNNSEVYLIPIHYIIKHIADSSSVSISREKAKEEFKQFKMLFLSNPVLLNLRTLKT